MRAPSLTARGLTRAIACKESVGLQAVALASGERTPEWKSIQSVIAQHKGTTKKKKRKKKEEGFLNSKNVILRNYPKHFA